MEQQEGMWLTGAEVGRGSARCAGPDLTMPGSHEKASECSSE